jgi:hypothetical protein
MNRDDEESEKFFAEFTPLTLLRTGLSVLDSSPRQVGAQNDISLLSL